jgi:intracellular septation protein
MKFLFDLFPVIVFFATYKLAGGSEAAGSCRATPAVSILHDPILLATGVAIAATFVQVGWLLLRKKKVDGMLWVSLGIVSVFGGATLYLRDPTFIQWKPTILYWTFSIIFFLSPFVLKRNLAQTVLEKQISLPARVWGQLNAAWTLFFLVMGAANLAAVYRLSCDAWVNFKFYGLTGLMLAFIVAQGLFLARYIEEEKQPGAVPPRPD